ncbi:AlpA family phage regulatory protein [Betaproteobacteria bacterium SCN2]|nr:AlpA family phage regulatory protein [Betaproteobacteria bacterium SCN2]
MAKHQATTQLPATGYASAKTLAAALEVSVTQVWRMSNSGSLPKPVKLGPATTRWNLSEVHETLAKLAA